jgi:hypothetical protein
MSEPRNAMNTIAVFINDARHAQHLLQPMVGPRPEARWVLVACAPRLTRRIGKFSAHANREQWRARWCERLFESVLPLFDGQPAGRPDTEVAHGPLLQVVAQLRRRHGDALQVLDARCPRLGTSQEPLVPASPDDAGNRWALPIALSSGVSVVLALAD